MGYCCLEIWGLVCIMATQRCQMSRPQRVVTKEEQEVPWVTPGWGLTVPLSTALSPEMMGSQDGQAWN